MPFYKLSFQIIVAVLTCFVLFRLVDWGSTVKILLRVQILPVIVAFALLYIGLFLSSYKWQILMKALNFRFRINELIRLYWVATFFQNFLPTSVGGDVVRITVLRNTKRLAQVTASILIERLTGFITLLALSFLVFLLRPNYFNLGDQEVIIWLILASLLLFIFALLLYGQKIIKVFKCSIFRKQKMIKSILSKFEKVLVSVGIYRKEKITIIYAFIVSLFFYLSLIVFQYLAFFSLGIEVPFIEVFLLAPLIPLISILPISLNGIGIAEGAFVILYTQLGISPEQALAVALLRRILLLVFSLVGGIFILSGRVSPSLE